MHLYVYIYIFPFENMILKTWTYTYLIIWIDQTCKCPWPPDHMQMYIYSDVSLSLSYEYQDICLMWQICSTLHMQYSICDFSMNHWWFFKVCLLEAISNDQVHLPRYLLGFKNMLWKKLVLCIYIWFCHPGMIQADGTGVTFWYIYIYDFVIMTQIC